MTGAVVENVSTIRFEKCVTIEDGWYKEKYPFDMVLGDLDGQEVVFRVEEVDFALVKLGK